MDLIQNEIYSYKFHNYLKWPTLSKFELIGNIIPEFLKNCRNLKFAHKLHKCPMSQKLHLKFLGILWGFQDIIWFRNCSFGIWEITNQSKKIEII